MTEQLRIRLLSGQLEATLPRDLVGAQVELRVGGRAFGTGAVSEYEEGARVRFPLPSSALNDGVSLVDLFRIPEGTHLGRYTLYGGDAMPDDIVAEVAMLWAELQALKKAFLTDAADPKLRAADRGLLVAEAVQKVEKMLAGSRSGRDEPSGGDV